MKFGIPWTPEEDAVLYEKHGKEDPRAMEAALAGRSLCAVKNRLQKLKLSTAAIGWDPYGEVHPNITETPDKISAEWLRKPIGVR